MKTKKTEAEIIQASVDLQLQELEANILGVTPFICNRMANKALHQLLYPTGRKTSARAITATPLTTRARASGATPRRRAS